MNNKLNKKLKGERIPLIPINANDKENVRCDALKDFAINIGINMCHSCGRISQLQFPHINGITYCPECLVKRMK